MNFNDKKVAMTGYTGFLGKALEREINLAGGRVVHLSGDVRNITTFSNLDYSYDYLFHFGAPSSQILFKREADYCIDVTVNGMRNAIEACQRNGMKLVFPSTGLLSHGQANEYARGKQICEDLARGADIDWLCVRVFGTYGPGEEQKRDFASVPWLFMSDLMAGRPPIVYGDGSQTRDFIYLDDTVESILHLAENVSHEIVDVGSGAPVSFNKLIELLNTELGSKIDPEYIDAPVNYIEKTGGDITRLSRFYKPRVSINEGIRRMVEYAKSHHHDNNQ